MARTDWSGIGCVAINLYGWCNTGLATKPKSKAECVKAGGTIRNKQRNSLRYGHSRKCRTINCNLRIYRRKN